jgi:mannose-6-phosphate isomerase-like protein (cupin superfamily)
MFAYLRGRDDAPAYWQMGILWIMLATAEDTGGEFTLMEQLMAAGPQAPPHLHEKQREGFYMLEGRARFTIGELKIDAGPGDFLTVPEETWHAFETLSEVRLLNWYTPAGFERIIIEAGVPATSQTLPPADLPPPDRALVQRLALEIGMRTQ